MEAPSMKGFLTVPDFDADKTCYIETISSRYGFTPNMRRRLLRKMEMLIPRLLEYPILKGKTVEIFDHEILTLCKLVNDSFMDEPVCLKIDLKTPLYVMGDLFAQYSDLLRIFVLLGWPPKARYLFLGNYVNRGSRGLETIVLLFLLRIRFPKHVYLLRGCHESEVVTRQYGLMEECVRRFDSSIWRELCVSFCHMPVVAMVENVVLCVHSGLSPIFLNNPHITNQHELCDFLNHCIARPVETEKNVMLRHLLWSEPESSIEGWEQNPNGLGYLFGNDVARAVCEKFNFQLILRSNEIPMHGYYFLGGTPHLATIGTAPHFHGAYKNDGAIVSLSKTVKEFSSDNWEIHARMKLVKPLIKFRSRETGRMTIRIEDVKEDSLMSKE